MPASTVCVVRLKVTGQPAWACRPRAQNSRAWAIETVSRWSDGIRSPSSGKRSRRRVSKPGSSEMATSAPSQVTMAWIAVWRLHKLGPRKARMRETSMTRYSSLFPGGSRLLGLRLFGGRQNQRCRVGQFEAEGLQAGGHHFLAQAQRPAGGDPGQHVGDVLGLLGLADVGRVDQAAETGLVVAGTQHDTIVDHRDAALAGGLVGNQNRVGRIDGKEDHLAVAQFGKVGDQFVLGVEHGVAAGQHDVDLSPVDRTRRRVVLAAGRLDIPARQVFIFRHDVGDDADRAAVVGQAFAENDFGAVLDNGGLDGAVEQQAAAAFPVGGAGLLDLAAAEVDAVLAGQAGMLAGQVDQVGDHLGDRVAAVGAADADQRHAAAFFRGKQVVDDGLADRARLADARLDVHQQPGAGIDFDDGAALFGQRLRDVLADQVDAGDVEADDAGGQRGDLGGVGMDFVGAVEGMIGVALDQHFAAGGRHAVGVQLLALEFHAGGGVDLDDRQRMQFGIAAARVGIDLAGDQFDDRGLAVAGHRDQVAAVGGDQLAADDQQAVFDALDRAFDQYAGAFLDGDGVGLGDFLAGHQVDEDAAPVVAVGRLDDDREADVLGGIAGIFGIIDLAAFGDRHADRGNQFLGQVLVARDGFGDGAGLVGFGRPDAAHRGAVAELDQVAVVEQADVRNLARFGGIDDGGRRRAEVLAVDPAAQRLDRLGEIERLVLDRSEQQLTAEVEGDARAFFVEVADHQLVDAARRRFAGAAEAVGQAGQGHQFEHDVFEDVAGPGAFLQAAEKAAALVVVAAVLDQAGQPGGEAVVEAGDLVGRVVFEFADVDPRFGGRRVGPDAWATQGNRVPKDNVLFLHALG